MKHSWNRQPHLNTSSTNSATRRIITVNPADPQWVPCLFPLRSASTFRNWECPSVTIIRRIRTDIVPADRLSHPERSMLTEHPNYPPLTEWPTLGLHRRPGTAVALLIRDLHLIIPSQPVLNITFYRIIIMPFYRHCQKQQLFKSNLSLQ